MLTLNTSFVCCRSTKILYFDIIKYPYLGLEDMGIYRQLPWDKDGIVCNDENDCFIPDGHTYQGGLARRSTDGAEFTPAVQDSDAPERDNDKNASANSVDIEERDSAVHLNLFDRNQKKSS